MSNMRFTIDAVPTPKIDLAAAFEQDMGYFAANRKFPPLGRSALRQAEERLNNYLKYVNENFIQEGFSSSSESVSTVFDTTVTQWSNNGVFTLTAALVTTATLYTSPGEKANLHISWNLCGVHEPEIIEETTGEGDEAMTTVTKNCGTLTVELWLDGTKQREWRQTLREGDNLVGASVCYANRAAGTHSVQLKASCSKGTLAIATNEHYAWGYGQIVREG